MYCHECKFYRDSDRFMGTCISPDTAIFNLKDVDSSGVYISERSNADYLYVGLNFGCIHFQEKEDEYSDVEAEEDGW